VDAEKDHIVPWEAAWRITQLLKSDVRYVLASSGHIAGIINPPGGRGTYWVNDSGKPAVTPQEWREGATAHNGSWWTDWTAWLAKHSGRKVNPPKMGSENYPIVGDAPGSYVLEK
jgi:polyhydroxyalkanoate synthase